jgi:predicted phosphodiesterase
MRRLILADIHANFPAFEAVLNDAGSFDEAVFLGDIVDCGPHPSECVDLLAEIGALCIHGNHDAGVLAVDDCVERRRDYVDWREWTYDQLRPDQRAYIASFPKVRSIQSCGRQATLIHQVHGAPYLHESMTDEQVVRHFASIDGEAIYSGHCHRLIDRTVDGKRYICFRAVGQQRDGDTRASYAIEEDGVLTHNLVLYDVERVARDTEQIGMDPTYTARFAAFVRTACDAEWSRDFNAYDETG